MATVSLMKLAAMANNASAFRTGAENFVQETLGVVGRWEQLWPGFNVYEAMREFNEDELKFAETLSDKLVLPVRR